MAKEEKKSTSEQKEETKEPSTGKQKKRSLPYRKIAFAAGILLGVILLIAFVGFLTIRSGYVDGYSNGWVNNYVKEQFSTAFDDMGVSMEADRFAVVFSPFRLEIDNAAFTNKKSGAKIATLKDLDLELTMLDVFGMKTSRDVVIDKTTIKGLDLYVTLDKDGKSNFEGIEMLPPTSSVRFQYATTEIDISDSRFHYGDEVRVINGTAKNMSATFTPDTERSPDSEDLSFKYAFETSKSTLTFGESEVDPIDIVSKGIISPNGLNIDFLSINSPVAFTEMKGKLTDWAALTYDLDISSKVNLSATSETFDIGSTIAGIGNFKGKVSGKGLKYKVSGEVTSDNLAASGVRLKAVKIIGSGDGESSLYKANGKAVAEMLTFGEYKIDYLSMIGNVRGNGADFKWLGELQAAAVKSPLGSIAGLYLSDAVAEYNEGRFDGSFNRLRARNFANDSVSVDGIQTGRIILDSNGNLTNASVPNATASKVTIGDSRLTDVRVNSARVSTGSAETTVNADSVSVGEYVQGDTKLGKTNASGVRITNRNGATDINAATATTEGVNSGSTKTGKISTKDLKVSVVGNETRVNTGDVAIARVETEAAILGQLNIAGVRLTVRDGVIEGETSDFEAGDVDLREIGQLSDVVAKNPVFVLEPSGKYRASLDMSLGSGVLGSITLGAAKAKVTADNDKVMLDELNAEVMKGRVIGDAVVALNNSSRSTVKADFEDLDIAKLIALQGGQIVPVEGKTNGKVDINFPGTNFNRASGQLNATIDASAGSDDRGFIPVSGEVGVNGTDGLFNIDFANLKTTKTNLNATGSFDLNGSNSSLNIDLNSSDAMEIDRIARVLELSNTLEDQLDAYDIQPKGQFAFNGTLTGNFSNPEIDGRATLETLTAQGRNVGRLSTNIVSTQDSVKLTDGLLVNSDGGRLVFGVDIPGAGTNNISVDAELQQMDIANILVLVQKNALPEQLRDITGKATGKLDLRGLPNDMNGTADLRTTNGTVNGQSFESVVAKANFEGNEIKLENFLATVGEGTLSASGNYNSQTTKFAFDTNAEKIPAEKILAFLPKFDSVPDVKGIINAKGDIEGFSNDTKSFIVNFQGFGDRVAINGSRLGRVDFNGITENQLLTATAATNFNREKQVINATVNFAQDDVPFNAVSDLKSAPIGPYIRIFRKEESGSVSIEGSVTGRIVATGNLTTLNDKGVREFTLDNIRGTADFSKAGFKFDEIPLDATQPVKINFSAREIQFDDAQFAGGGSNLVITGSKALADDAVNNLAVTGRLNLGIVRAFSRNSLRNIFISGIADLAIRLSGVNETARLNGTALIERGSASTFVGSNRITFERLNGRVRFTTNQIQFDSITGTLGGGQVQASGGALLGDDLSLNKIRIGVRGTNVTAPLPNDFLTTGNAEIQINGRLEGNRFDTIVSGRVVARRSIYRKDLALADLINSRRDATLAQTVSEPSTGGVVYSAPRFDIRIIGRNSLVVRNNLADLTASLDLRMLGNSDEIELAGRITSTDGVLFFRDDRYEIQRGVLEFPPNTNIEPVVSITAESDINGYQVRINLNGKLTDSESLSLVTSSNPSLPENDILSLITRGRLANTSGGLPVVAQGGINTAARIVTDEIINRPVAKATDKLFGLNKFELDPIVSGERGNSTARLTVGRQINRNLSATYSTNLSEDQNQVLSVEYRLSNRLSFVAAYEQRSLTNVTQRRNEFRIEIRLRKRF